MVSVHIWTLRFRTQSSAKCSKCSIALALLDSARLLPSKPSRDLCTGLGMHGGTWHHRRCRLRRNVRAIGVAMSSRLLSRTVVSFSILVDGFVGQTQRGNGGSKRTAGVLQEAQDALVTAKPAWRPR